VALLPKRLGGRKGTYIYSTAKKALWKGEEGGEKVAFFCDSAGRGKKKMCELLYSVPRQMGGEGGGGVGPNSRFPTKEEKTCIHFPDSKEYATGGMRGGKRGGEGLVPDYLFAGNSMEEKGMVSVEYQ